MKGSDVFKTAVNTLGKLAKHTLELNNLERVSLTGLSHQPMKEHLSC